MSSACGICGGVPGGVEMIDAFVIFEVVRAELVLHGLADDRRLCHFVAKAANSGSSGRYFSFALLISRHSRPPPAFAVRSSAATSSLLSIPAPSRSHAS